MLPVLEQKNAVTLKIDELIGAQIDMVIKESRYHNGRTPFRTRYL